MYWRALLLVGVVGCGVPPESLCSVEGAKWITADPGLSVDCAAVQRDLYLARDVLAQRGIVPPEKFGAAEVHYRAENYWAFGAGMAIGEYDPNTETIQLNFVGGSLLHEMLHHWESVNGRAPNIHDGWETNGYFDADAQFKSAFVQAAHPL